jgi:hypothetical protein
MKHTIRDDALLIAHITRTEEPAHASAPFRAVLELEPSKEEAHTVHVQHFPTEEDARAWLAKKLADSPA